MKNPLLRKLSGYLTRLLCQVFILIVSIGAFGCKSGSGDASSGHKTGFIPDQVSQLPYEKELSTTEGVKIMRNRPDVTGAYTYSSDGVGGRSAQATNARLEDLIPKWTDFEGWIFVTAEFPDTYNVEVEAPEGKTAYELSRQAFESVFGLQYTEAIEPTEVWVLSRNEDTRLSMKPVESRSPNWGSAQTPGGFGIDFRAGSMEDLANILAKYFEGGIVIDETGLEGRYKFVLSMDHWKPETAAPAVEELGLKVTRATRDLPILRIDYVDQAR